MDRYTKGFVIASLVYFSFAACAGVWMGMGSESEWVLFAHIHLNLLGFMTMMIYGVGYFILPRFNARNIRWPSLVPVHFYVANLGLIGMVVSAPGRPSMLFTASAVLSMISVLLFCVNLGVTLLGAVPEEEDEIKDVTFLIRPDTRMSEILERWPELVEILISNGFAPLADPAHREKIKSLPVTLEMACSRHDLDLDLMMNLLNKGAAALARGTGGEAPAVQSFSAINPMAKSLAAGEPVGPDHIIGDILKIYPATDKVFRKYYGAACFSCPGQSTETIKQSAMMHNVPVKDVLADLNKVSGIS